jgi:hypothetical protein
MRWWWWWWGCALTNARRKRELGAKPHETERGGSILGELCETVAKGDDGRWWGEVDEVVVVGGLRVGKCEVEKGARGQILQN